MTLCRGCLSGRGRPAQAGALGPEHLVPRPGEPTGWGMPSGNSVVGTRGPESLDTVDELKPMPGEVVIHAYGLDKFYGTHSVLSFMTGADEWKDFADAGADIIRLWDDWVTLDLVERIQGCGREVWVMTGRPSVREVGITTTYRLRELWQLGVEGVPVSDLPAAVTVCAGLHGASVRAGRRAEGRP